MDHTTETTPSPTSTAEPLPLAANEPPTPPAPAGDAPPRTTAETGPAAEELAMPEEHTITTPPTPPAPAGDAPPRTTAETGPATEELATTAFPPADLSAPVPPAVASAAAIPPEAGSSTAHGADTSTTGDTPAPSTPLRTAPFWTTPWGGVALVAVAMLATYLPLTAVPFLFNDDYILTFSKDLEHTLPNGRHLYYILLRGIRAFLAMDLERVVWLRLLNVLLMAGLAATLFTACRRIMGRPLPALATTLLILASGFPQIAVAWLFNIPVLLALSGVTWAFLLVTREERLEKRHWLGTLLILWAGADIYQPVLFFFAGLFPLLILWGERRLLALMIRRLPALVGLALATVALWWLGHQLALHLLALENSPRIGGALHRIAGGDWAFLRNLILYRGGELAFSTHTLLLDALPTLAIALALCAVGFIAHLLAPGPDPRWLVPLRWLGAGSLTLACTLLVPLMSQYQFSYRAFFYGVPGWVAMAVLSWHLLGRAVARHRPRALPHWQRWSPPLAAGVVIAALISAQLSILRGIAIPNALELHGLRTQLAARMTPTTSGIHMLRATLRCKHHPRRPYEGFFATPLASPFSSGPQGMVRLSLAMLGYDPMAYRITYSDTIPPDLPPEWVVVDLHTVQELIFPGCHGEADPQGGAGVSGPGR